MCLSPPPTRPLSPTLNTERQRNTDWPYEKISNLEERVRQVLKKLSLITLQEMAHSGPWPTRLMSGPEVHPPRTNPCPYGAVVKRPFEKTPRL